MTELLRQAFDRAASLPDQLQDELARELLDDLEGEARWADTLAKSQDLLERMADRALLDAREGRTKRMGFDEL
jgi:HD superfamily phosphohydrolase